MYKVSFTRIQATCYMEHGNRNSTILLRFQIFRKAS
ncbi:hypothetical protein COPEUT_02816 [Coprococcus eutactus ATCC 27759]|nr:hypothetical protein COPEUT_02816 [Coprococcus eutactus ATCC 27759]